MRTLGVRAPDFITSNDSAGILFCLQECIREPTPRLSQRQRSQQIGDLRERRAQLGGKDANIFSQEGRELLESGDLH